MTYEQLFQFIASIQPSLPKCALPVLIHLIDKVIGGSSNVVAISDRALAKEVNISRDAVSVAAKALSPIIAIEGGERLLRKWTLPAEWFYEQRSLFASKQAVENPSDWRSNQASTGGVTRPDWRSYQASTGGVTRPALAELPGQWRSNQASTGGVTRPAGGVTRPDSTQNQQLTDSGDTSIDRSETSKATSITEVIDRLLAVENLNPEQVDDAQALSEDLCAYMQELGPARRDRNRPDGKILAECLAIAPLRELTFLLRTLRAEKKTAGSSYAWFTTTLLQRRHGIHPSVLAQARQHRKPRKQPGREADPQFTTELLQQTFSNVRNFRNVVNS